MAKTTIESRKIVALHDELMRRAQENGWYITLPTAGGINFSKEINGSKSDLRVTFAMTGDIREAEFDGSVLPQLVVEDLALAILG
jgi:hypothetical protein